LAKVRLDDNFYNGHKKVTRNNKFFMDLESMKNYILSLKIDLETYFGNLR
jgi:hypothetical protein